MKHSTSLNDDRFLGDALIGRMDQGAEVVTPGPHSWDGSYTDLRIDWKGESWRIQSAHNGNDLVLLVSPLGSTAAKRIPPTVVFSVNFLWNHPGFAMSSVVDFDEILADFGNRNMLKIHCTCTTAPTGSEPGSSEMNLPVAGAYFASDLAQPVGMSTGKRRTLEEIQAVIAQGERGYRASIASRGETGPIVDAIETTLGWDTIYEPDKNRVISPVSRVWSVGWGGYVLFDWDTFFAATLASVGDRDLAYANAVEILREETPEGFVPNYARPGWKSFDRSEPPVGAITVLGLYKRFHDRWLLEETFQPLLSWNRWWAKHRDVNGYLAWGSDGQTPKSNPDDGSEGTAQGAIYESGLDNSPMYDGASYDSQSHLLEVADVGLMSMYVADCDALAEIADTLAKTEEARELRERSAQYRTKLATMWDEKAGIFLNKDLVTGESGLRLSPTNFYPMLALAATPDQAKRIVEKHLLNTDEFWGEWVIPSIERNDAAFHDQNYWRGRIWGPMNYLIYLGLANYDDAKVRKEFAQKSYNLFLKDWSEKRHVHENYNAITGTGDDVTSSDRFYHWGALLGYVEYLEQNEAAK
jgi:hypothetical protein